MKGRERKGKEAFPALRETPQFASDSRRKVYTVNVSGIQIGENMATALVAGRVDSDIKSQVDMHMKRMGVSQSDVIRVVWSNIAKTGVIPTPVPETSSNNLRSRLDQLRAETPRSDFLENLTPEVLKEELGNRE